MERMQCNHVDDYHTVTCTGKWESFLLVRGYSMTKERKFSRGWLPAGSWENWCSSPAQAAGSSPSSERMCSVYMPLFLKSCSTGESESCKRVCIVRKGRGVIQNSTWLNSTDESGRKGKSSLNHVVSSREVVQQHVPAFKQRIWSQTAQAWNLVH